MKSICSVCILIFLISHSTLCQPVLSSELDQSTQKPIESQTSVRGTCADFVEKVINFILTEFHRESIENENKQAIRDTNRAEDITEIQELNGSVTGNENEIQMDETGLQTLNASCASWLQTIDELKDAILEWRTAYQSRLMQNKGNKLAGDIASRR
ncbi:hypothetical protein ACOME3_005780 [Neoechinorhynchus agilis]